MTSASIASRTMFGCSLRVANAWSTRLLPVNAGWYEISGSGARSSIEIPLDLRQGMAAGSTSTCCHA
jgi:hypothetical protein